MTIRKRLRVCWAALWQDWHEETCDTCAASWWTDRRCIPSYGLCVDCEDRQFSAWVTHHEHRQQTTPKEVA